MAEFSDLQTFIAVAHSGSFASAARRLSLSPAMVGRRIQALEERYVLGSSFLPRPSKSSK
jgi:DNA-binding transcriptional LysR family regulator